MDRVAPPIISIAGRSNSGKTTLIEKLIPRLKARGYRIATIKHDVHGIDIDTPGKDSWRHREAGADAVVLVSEQLLFYTERLPKHPSLAEIQARFLDGAFDLVITEGFKHEGFAKIEVHRSARSSELVSSVDDETLVAVVSDVRHDDGRPWFHIDDVDGIAGFIEKRFLDSSRASA